MPVLFVFFCSALKNLISEHQKYTKRSPKASKMEVCRPPKRELETEEIRKSLKTAKLSFATDRVSVRERLGIGSGTVVQRLEIEFWDPGSLGPATSRAVQNLKTQSEPKHRAHSTEPDLTTPMGTRPGEFIMMIIIMMITIIVVIIIVMIL